MHTHSKNCADGKLKESIQHEVRPYQLAAKPIVAVGKAISIFVDLPFILCFAALGQGHLGPTVAPREGGPSRHGDAGPTVAKGGSRLITPWCALVFVGVQYPDHDPRGGFTCFSATTKCDGSHIPVTTVAEILDFVA